MECPQRTFGKSQTIYRKCPLIERACGHGPWVRGDRCGNCDQKAAPKRLDPSFVVAAAKALASPILRGEKSETEVVAVLQAHVRDAKEVENALVGAVRAGGLTAARATELAKEAGLDPDRKA